MAPLPALVRRAWPEFVGVLLGVVMLLADVSLYQPAQARMRRAERAAQAAGITLDPRLRPALIPAPVERFVTANSLEEAEAAAAARTGSLTAGLLGELTGLAGQSGLVVTATEPGVTLQQPEGLVARARLRARGSYASFLRFLGAVGRSDHLLTVDQFAIAGEGGDCTIELWVSRHVLKRTPNAKAPR